MGTELNDIINVNITRETAKVTQEGFGTAMIFGPVTEFEDAYGIYSDIDEVAEDFASDSEPYKAANALFSQEISPEKVVIGSRDTAEALADELSAVEAEMPDWYSLVLTRYSDEAQQLADIAAAAAWCESRRKLYLGAIDQASMITSATDDIASVLKAAAYDRSGIMYSEDHANYPEAAWFGRCLPEDPGSITWKFKTLAGITVDTLSTTAVTNLRNKNANFYELIAGVNVISSEAVTAGGEYLDIIRGCDWLEARIAEAVFTRLINSKKVPFTAQGIVVIENEIRYWLEKAVDVDLIVDGSIKITAPAITDVSTTEKAIRYLNGLKFSGELAGAIHKARIEGRLTV